MKTTRKQFYRAHEKARVKRGEPNRKADSKPPKRVSVSDIFSNPTNWM